MMDDNKKKYHAIWRLEENPYTAQDIFEKYGWRVTEDHQRIKKYKLTGRKRAHKIAKVLREKGRHADAEKLIADMEATVAAGKRFICNFPKD
jgi:hypothetical protein